MFKKPLADLKTTAPIRGSDRRKLRQRVVAEFGLTSTEAGDLLVPEGIQTQKFKTHVDEPGILYLSPEGDPLWFTVGKGSDALIPTVYTLWKEPSLLPFLTTPEPVVPKLVGGADLMIPGVVQHSSDFKQDQLLAISQYHREGSVVAYPIAVGRAAVSSDTLKRADELDVDVKGKAVYVLHTWKDALWELGPSRKMDVPPPRAVVAAPETEATDVSGTSQPDDVEKPAQTLNELALSNRDAGTSEHTGDQGVAGDPTLRPEDVSSCFRNALLQAISTTLSAQPTSAFPMSASVFWTNYVLPARPAQAFGPDGLVDSSAIDIKHSTHKSVKTFLKSCAKEGLLKLKETKGDVVVTGVFPKHQAVVDHKPHRTVQSLESRKEKAAARERQEKEAEEKKKGEIHITELLKPFDLTIPWFVASEKSTEGLYTPTEVREIFNAYVSAKQLVNANDPQYVNVAEDDSLTRAISTKGQPTPEFVKRDDAIKKVQKNMQNWYGITTEGGAPVTKKGEVQPVSVSHKMRQGRKAVTLISGFELFGLDANELAEELRKICSSSTSVTPMPGGKSHCMEVMVQGKQMKLVTTFLISKGVPKKWIHGVDEVDAKKKK